MYSNTIVNKFRLPGWKKNGKLEEMIWIDVVKKRRQTQILQPEDIYFRMGFLVQILISDLI